ncbi:MAG: hypothetical protein V4467_02355 [Patescibacteria group bacterium]
MAKPHGSPADWQRELVADILALKNDSRAPGPVSRNILSSRKALRVRKLKPARKKRFTSGRI